MTSAQKPSPRPQSGETVTGHVHIRTTLERKSAWVRAAKPRPLAKWAIEKLDSAAEYSESEK